MPSVVLVAAVVARVAAVLQEAVLHRREVPQEAHRQEIPAEVAVAPAVMTTTIIRRNAVVEVEEDNGYTKNMD